MKKKIFSDEIIKELCMKNNISSLLNKKEEDEREYEQKEEENIKEVAPATSLTSEDIHGGNEATGDIENSPNHKEEKVNNNQEKNKKGANGFQNKWKNKSNGIKKIPLEKINNMIDEKKLKVQKQKDKLCSCETKEEYMKTIVNIFEELSKKYAGFLKETGGNKWNKNSISKYLVSEREYLIPKAREHQSHAKKVSIFIDTSASLYLFKDAIKEVIWRLSRKGFNCYLYGAGNGFWYEDCSNDSYDVRTTLENIEGGIVPKLCRLTIPSAIKVANSSEFSVIISDFDGLSDIVKMAEGCQKEKMPYFICVEGRYSWDDPTEHDWVDYEYSQYPDENRVYQIVEQEQEY